MRRINYISVLVFIFFFFTKCSWEKEQLSPLTIELALLNEAVVKDSLCNYSDNIVSEYIENKNYEVQLLFKNNTDSVISLVLMSCSWDENIIINTPFINYIPIECNKNFPRLIEIQPYGSHILIANLEKNKFCQECESCPSYNKIVDLKMGLILVPKLEVYDSIMDDKSSWNIIWSEPIVLKK